MMNDQEIVDSIHTNTLNKIPFSFGLPIRGSWLETVTVEQYIEEVSDELAVRVNFAIPGVSYDRTVLRPKTWWDGFKERFFPNWLTLLIPIEYEHIAILTVNQLQTDPKHELYKLEQRHVARYR